MHKHSSDKWQDRILMPFSAIELGCILFMHLTDIISIQNENGIEIGSNSVEQWESYELV